jgi:hypothetical protein
VSALVPGHSPRAFFAAARGFVFSPERRWLRYRPRLERSAWEAAERGIGRFSTALLSIPRQRRAVIREMGERAAELFGVEFLCQDFGAGWAFAVRGGAAAFAGALKTPADLGSKSPGWLGALKELAGAEC